MEIFAFFAWQTASARLDSSWLTSKPWTKASCILQLDVMLCITFTFITICLFVCQFNNKHNNDNINLRPLKHSVRVMASGSAWMLDKINVIAAISSKSPTSFNQTLEKIFGTEEFAYSWYVKTYLHAEFHRIGFVTAANRAKSVLRALLVAHWHLLVATLGFKASWKLLEIGG